MRSNIINFVFICLSVWSFLSSDVNRDNIKIYGNLVRCNAFRGKAQKATCGTVLGIIERHANSQVFHLVNIRQILSERLPGPLSSFRYNLKAKVSEPRPLIFSNKKKILHSMLKIPMKIGSNNSPEYAIRTVHCRKSNVEIGYLHVQEHEPVLNVFSEVEPPRITSRSFELGDLSVAGPSSREQNSVNKDEQHEFVPNDVRFAPNQYPDLGSETYGQFPAGIQVLNSVQSETLSASTSNVSNRLNCSQENLDSVQYFGSIQTNAAAERVADQLQGMSSSNSVTTGNFVRVPVIVESGNYQSSEKSSAPKDIVVLRDEPVPSYYHSGKCEF